MDTKENANPSCALANPKLKAIASEDAKRSLQESV